MSNVNFKEEFHVATLKDVSSSLGPMTLEATVPFKREDIWGADFHRYQQEVFQLSLALFALSGLIMIFASALSIFGQQLSVIQGAGFAVFLAGLAALAKVFWENSQRK